MPRLLRVCRGALCALLAIAGMGGGAFCAAAPPLPTSAALTLTEAQELAARNNWDLLAAAAGVDAAMAQRVVATEFPNPTLSFGTSKINVDHHPNSTVEGNGLWDRSYDTVVAVNQLIEIGGKRRSRQASARAGFEEARALLLDVRRTLDLGVAKAYAAAALAQANAAVLRQSATSLQEEARLASARLEAGEISAADKAQIEISAERFEQEARAAESAAAQARVSLEVLLGIAKPGPDCTLTDSIESLAESAQGLSPQATGVWRPDVVAAEAALRKSEADWRLQKAVRIPDPTLLAQYEHNPADAPNSVGLGVSFPLPLWNRNRGNILAADAAREQARLAFEKARSQAAADIAIARLAFEDAAKRWENYRSNIRPKSEQVRKTKAYAYQRGGASLLDMLVAERDDNEVRLAALQAASDAATAIATLKSATVEIQPSQVKK